MTTLTFVNAAGRRFTTRVVREGDTYGLDHCLTYTREGDRLTFDPDEVLVEFYDATYAGDDRFDPVLGLGQFVSRYYGTTLLDGDRWSPRKRGTGLCLDGGNADVWSIDGATMEKVLEGLESQISDGGKA